MRPLLGCLGGFLAPLPWALKCITRLLEGWSQSPSTSQSRRVFGAGLAAQTASGVPNRRLAEVAHLQSIDHYVVSQKTRRWSKEDESLFHSLSETTGSRGHPKIRIGTEKQSQIDETSRASRGRSSRQSLRDASQAPGVSTSLGRPVPPTSATSPACTHATR